MVVSTSPGPVPVGSQVENIVYSTGTVAQYIGIKANPPSINAQPGPWDFAKNLDIAESDEYPFLRNTLTNMMIVSAAFADAMAPCAIVGAGLPVIWAACTGTVVLFVSAGLLLYQHHVNDYSGIGVILTPSAAITHGGTDFTVGVDANGTTTVTAINGSVIVMDIRSNNSVRLINDQSITVPKTAKGLSTAELQQRVVYANPALIDNWWDKPPAKAAPLAAQKPVAGGYWAVPIALLALLVLIGLVAGIRRLGRKRK